MPDLGDVAVHPPPRPRTPAAPHPSTRTIPNRTHRRQGHPRPQRHQTTNPQQAVTRNRPFPHPKGPKPYTRSKPAKPPVTTPPPASPHQGPTSRPLNKRVAANCPKGLSPSPTPTQATATPPTPHEGYPAHEAKTAANDEHKPSNPPEPPTTPKHQPTTATHPTTTPAPPRSCSYPTDQRCLVVRPIPHDEPTNSPDVHRDGS